VLVGQLQASTTAATLVILQTHVTLFGWSAIERFGDSIFKDRQTQRKESIIFTKSSSIFLGKRNLK